MNRAQKAAALIASVVSLVVSAPASATIISATYSGHIQNGTDIAGVFGAANGNLAGSSFTATYIYDTELGIPRQNSGSNGNTNFENQGLQGGSIWGAPSPLLAFTLDVNGQLFQFLASSLTQNVSIFSSRTSSTSCGFFRCFTNTNFGVSHGFGTTGGGTGFGSNATVGNYPSFSLQPGFLLSYSSSSNNNQPLGSSGGAVDGLFNISGMNESIVVAEYASVPEPASLGLLGLGLAGIGFARRRKAAIRS